METSAILYALIHKGYIEIELVFSHCEVVPGTQLHAQLSVDLAPDRFVALHGYQPLFFIFCHSNLDRFAAAEKGSPDSIKLSLFLYGTPELQRDKKNSEPMLPMPPPF